MPTAILRLLMTATGPGGVDGLADVGIQPIQVFPIPFQHGQAVTFQGFLHAEAAQILGRMTGNGDIVVIDQQLHIDVVRHRQPGRLGIVTFLLGTVRPQTENGFYRDWPELRR